VIDMLKTLLLIVGGLGAGLAIAFWLQPPSPATPPFEAGAARAAAPGERFDGNEAGLSAARLAALEAAFAAEVERRGALEARVAELSAELDALGERPARESRVAEGANDGLDPTVVEQRARVVRDARLTPEERQRRTIEQLVAAGFAPDRAEWINRRTQELRMDAMQAQYEARREGRQPPPDVEATALRAELGDQDYERFLTAMGRSTSVNIMGVLASSPAERAGLQPGDEIVGYNGQRVFDVAELNELTLGGNTGESVLVDVRRNGQSLQLVMPRGPLGIWGGFRGTPVPLER
jgi:DNA-binding transcriptional ArsR family regulator